MPADLANRSLCRRLCVIAALVLLLTACASPGERLQREALAAGLEHRAVATVGYSLSAYERSEPRQARTLHVYLDSDGSPWERGLWPARDPTPRHSLALSLMRLDPQPTIYLNRPCYGLPKLPSNCHPDLWTGARYSATVVDALNEGLESMRRRYRAERLVLIGHSGGGALAMLLAARRQDVAAVVTIAANLDHRRWTQHFGYQPLSASLNTVDQPPLSAAVLRWHLVGERDAVVPAKLTVEAAADDSRARVLRYSEFDHSCCWARIWPELLAELRRALESP